jgi:NO-binding membrane sensor protein with MHYT domain
MATEQLVLPGFHDPRLVALSVFISILGAYAARDLIERLRDARGRARLAWLVGGATADGIGIWSMHYTGMMAFVLPIPVLYDLPMVLVSLLVGISGSAAALAVLSHDKIGWERAIPASMLVGGIGISGLHYTAMAAMRFQGMHRYVPGLVALSVLLAMLFCLMALLLSHVLRDGAPRHSLRSHGSAVLRGLANPVMHYTSMAGTIFIYSAQSPDVSHAVNVTALGIAGTSIVPIMLLVVVLMTSAMDRTRKQRALLDDHGLLAALRWIAAQFSRRTRIRAEESCCQGSRRCDPRRPGRRAIREPGNRSDRDRRFPSEPAADERPRFAELA